MIDQNLIFCELSQRNSFQSPVEIAIALETSVSEVRQVLRNLGDLVETNDDDEWRVVKKRRFLELFCISEAMSMSELKKYKK